MNMPISGAGLTAPPPLPVAAPRLLPNAAAMLSDGAEELGFGIAAPRPPGRRAISKFSNAPRQSKINQVLALLESGAAASGGRYARLQRLSKSARGSSGQIEGFLKSSGLNAEDSMLLLQQILNDMDAEGDDMPAFRLQVAAAQQALDEDCGIEIRARIHALEATLQQDMNPLQAASFQDGYLAMVLSSGNCAIVLDELLRRFHRQLRFAMKLLIATLGRELDSQWRSCEAGYLHLLRQALYELGGIANTYDDCEMLMRRWQEKNALLHDDTVQLARDLVRLSADPWPVSMKFTTLAEKYSAHRWQLAFLGRLRNVIHAMPYRLFLDDASQARVHEAIQQAVDIAADREAL